MNIQIQEFELFKAISEEIRLRIVILLTERELCVCDVMKVLDLPQSSVSRHMAKLKSAKMVIDRRDGKWVHYRLNGDINNYLPSFDTMLLQIKDRQPYQSDRDKLSIHFLTNNCK